MAHRRRWPDQVAPLAIQGGAIHASGADYDAPGARDYSAEGRVGFSARDFPASRHAAFDGSEALERAEGAELSWPLPEGMNDDALEAALYANRRSKRGHRRVEEPDWANVHRELKRKHVTLTILWDEYIAENPGGYRYSRFCELYRAFEKTLSVTMRQTHAAGERLFVDYAGDGVPVVVDRLTGEVRTGQIFVAVLGASRSTARR